MRWCTAAAFARSVVNRFQVAIPRQVGGQDEAAIDIGTLGGHGKALARLEDHVGRPELPPLGETWAAAAGPWYRRSGAPASAQAARMAISAWVNDWSCLSLGPTPAVGFQGGIDRSSVTEAMSRDRLRACS